MHVSNESVVEIYHLLVLKLLQNYRTGPALTVPLIGLSFRQFISSVQFRSVFNFIAHNQSCTRYFAHLLETQYRDTFSELGDSVSIIEFTSSTVSSATAFCDINNAFSLFLGITYSNLPLLLKFLKFLKWAKFPKIVLKFALVS